MEFKHKTYTIISRLSTRGLNGGFKRFESFEEVYKIGYFTPKQIEKLLLTANEKKHNLFLAVTVKTTKKDIKKLLIETINGNTTSELLLDYISNDNDLSIEDIVEYCKDSIGKWGWA